MLNRRQFLNTGVKALGGLTFCSCGILGKAQAQNIPVQRPPLIIQGKRIKAIDVHAHCYFQEAIDLMGADAKSVLAPTRGQTKTSFKLKSVSPQCRLRELICKF
jgi:aminocarboxymuconate-semialdehyde decarboxylase